MKTSYRNWWMILIVVSRVEGSKGVLRRENERKEVMRITAGHNVIDEKTRKQMTDRER